MNYTVGNTVYAAITLSDDIRQDNPITLSPTDEYTSKIDYSGDADYFKFTSIGTAYKIFTTGYPTNIDSKAWLYECNNSSCSSLVEVAYNDDHGNASSYNGFSVTNINESGMGTLDFEFQVDLQNYGNKTFLVKIMAYSGTGSYNLHIEKMDTNGSANPQNISPNTTINSYINWSGDTDYYEFIDNRITNENTIGQNYYYTLIGSTNVNLTLNADFNYPPETGMQEPYKITQEIYEYQDFHTNTIEGNLLQLSTYNTVCRINFINITVCDDLIPLKSNILLSSNNTGQYNVTLNNSIMYEGIKINNTTVKTAIFYYDYKGESVVDAYFFNNDPIPGLNYTIDLLQSNIEPNDIIEGLGLINIIGETVLFISGVSTPLTLIPSFILTLYDNMTFDEEALLKATDNMQAYANNNTPMRVIAYPDNQYIEVHIWDGIHLYYDSQWGYNVGYQFNIVENILQKR